ncbi:flagellar hook-basal body complex protein FliE [Mesorhizobium sp.]|jgi:flagellar hook-basal body complex protein FliE|uniref:flagellar hook-basal body complex protein FliE n=1 Tax=Mesorhizobium sp. TaxID=1871066 RepID=UPI0025D2DB62|nr:flagellar hook-basal body complex protein FliE [Mesorhizobium sp.]
MEVRAADVLALRSAILQRNAALRDTANVAPATNAAQGVEQADTPKTSFASTLTQAIQKVNSLQEQEDVATESYERGETTDIATVALIQQRASVSFEATLQVRNKVLSAYKDIMNMAL